MFMKPCTKAQRRERSEGGCEKLKCLVFDPNGVVSIARVRRTPDNERELKSNLSEYDGEAVAGEDEAANGDAFGSTAVMIR